MKTSVLAVAMIVGCAMATQAQSGDVVKHIQSDKSPLAAGVWVGSTYYMSGTLASPVTPEDKAKGTPAVYGDTKTQTTSILTKIQAGLKEQGLDMKDVVKMTVFLAGDPAKGGKADVDGMNAAFREFFGTPAQPNKPARSTVQVAALVVPWGLLEIEVIAAKSK
jgi:enamine deaminase RidA (YjgF/YER057c/UK114 family)